MSVPAIVQPTTYGRPVAADQVVEASLAAVHDAANRPRVPSRHRRLVGKLDALELRLAALEQAGGGAHVEAARLHWRSAWAAIARREHDTAWLLRDAAERELLGGATAAELDDQAAALAAEGASKLLAWRRTVVLDLCKAAGVDAADLATRRARLALAMRIRDEHAHDHIQKVERLRAQLVGLGVVLFAALAAAVATMWARGVAFETRADDPRVAGGPMLVLVALFGATGGAFSAAVGVAQTRTEGRIPDQIVAGYSALLRPLLGAAGAVAFYAFLRAGLGIQPSTEAFGAYAFWAFAAGFSERMLARTVDSAAGRVGGAPGPGA